MATSLPHEAERREALAIVPWHYEIRRLAGFIRGSLDNQAVDAIDASLAEQNHVRAALVALYDGADFLFQATLDLAESVARESVLTRLLEDVRDPLGRGEVVEPPDTPLRFVRRAARIALEDAVIRSASAGDHLANALVRIAWEVNAATVEEAWECGFDPEDYDPARWIAASKLEAGLRLLRKRPLSVFAGFSLNAELDTFMSNTAVGEARDLRDAIVHRERPSYAEAPAMERTTLWMREAFRITFPPPGEQSAPTLAQRRAVVADAIREGVVYANAMWDLTRRWLATVGVDVNLVEGVRVETRHFGRPAHPRASRDPGPFLTT